LLGIAVQSEWANGGYDVALIPAKKSGEAYLPDFFVSPTFIVVFIFANIPKLRPLWVIRVLAWVRPSNRNTGRFWRSTVVIRLAYSSGI
jgi:hypothetical protein